MMRNLRVIRATDTWNKERFEADGAAENIEIDQEKRTVLDILTPATASL